MQILSIGCRQLDAKWPFDY